MGNRGWVYVISNQSMPGLLKIGFSSKDPHERAAELDNTGCPQPYVVEFDMLVTSPREVEQLVHARLAEKRDGKEWFRITLEEAIAGVEAVATSYPADASFSRSRAHSASLSSAPKSQFPSYTRTNRSAKWRFSQGLHTLLEKSGGRRYGPDHCSFDSTAVNPGFVVNDRAVLWVALDDVEVID